MLHDGRVRVKRFGGGEEICDEESHYELLVTTFVLLERV
jgi:hypothetical protein